MSGSIGLNILPASIFTLLGSTAIVFSIILSRVFTNKKVSPVQLLLNGIHD